MNRQITIKMFLPRAKFLNLGTTDIWSKMILIMGEYSIHYRVFSSSPSLYPPYASHIPMQLWNQKCLQTLAHIKTPDRGQLQSLSNDLCNHELSSLGPFPVYSQRQSAVPLWQLYRAFFPTRCWLHYCTILSPFPLQADLLILTQMQHMSQDTLSFLEWDRVGENNPVIGEERKHTPYSNVVSWQFIPLLKICWTPFYNTAIKMWARGQRRTRALSVLAPLVRSGFSEELSVDTVCSGVRIPDNTLRNKGPGRGRTMNLKIF